MITKVEEFRDKHTVSGNNKGDILITGFANVENKKCFCIMADGHRYHEYGISTGSLLLCKRGAAINDGELIIVKEDGAFAIYLYLKDRKIKEDGDKRILHSKSKAYAKVIGSFNFFE